MGRDGLSREAAKESGLNGQKKGDLAKINPYLVAAGTELDDLVSLALDEQAGLGRSNPYSTETSSADVLLKELRLRYKVKIIIGKTTIHQKPWFARFGTDPSTSTEIVAETYPLALSRLSLLLAIQRDT